MPDERGEMTVEEATQLVGSANGPVCKPLWDGLDSVQHDDYRGAQVVRANFTQEQQLACKILRYGPEWAHGHKLRMHGREEDLRKHFNREPTRLEYEDDLFGAGPLPPPGAGTSTKPIGDPTGGNTGGGPTTPTTPTTPTLPTTPTTPTPPVTEQSCESFIAPYRMKLEEVNNQLIDTQKKLEVVEARLAAHIADFNSLVEDRDKLIEELRSIKRLNIPAEITQSLETLERANVLNDTLRARALRVKAFIELTSSLQPIPSEHVGTLKWIASVSQYGPGRRAAIKRLNQWLESNT